MKPKTTHITFFLVTTGVIALLLAGFKSPPRELSSTEISMIHAVAVSGGISGNLSNKQKRYWKGLNFKIALTDYPGETPDYVVALKGERSEFIAIYNYGSDKVFFSFIPEIEYGILNNPPAGGWTKPLYTTNATDELLDLLKIE